MKMSAACPAQSTDNRPRSRSAAQAASREGAARLSGKLAAVTGAAAAAIAGDAVADTITYVPTPGVNAALNIPGFTYTSPTNVTPGTLRPPVSVPLTVVNTPWDVDGDGNADFNLVNAPLSALRVGILYPASPFATNPNGLLQQDNGTAYMLVNLLSSVAIGPGASVWRSPLAYLTFNQAGVGNNFQSNFTTNVPGYFGFRFAFDNTPNTYYYGWGSLTIDFGGDPALPGQGFKITEAYYQSTPNTAIFVGEVPEAGPAPVPELSGEPSGLALLAAGALGLEAWRNRRRREPAVAG
jgi:hypothetical protein